jgi:membrane protein
MSHATARTDRPRLTAVPGAHGQQAQSLPRRAWSVLREAVAEAREHDVTTTAQALAYSFFLAIPAMFLVLLGAFSLVASPSDVERLIDRLARVMPPEAAQLLGDSLQRTIQSTGSGITFVALGFGLALWTTSSAATTLMKAVTRAFDQDDDRSFARKRLLALLLVACFLAAAMLVVGLLVFGPFLQGWVGGAIGAPSATAWLWWTAQWPLLVGALLFLFAVLLYVAPDVQQPRWRLVTPGAAASVVIWLVASGAFAFYTAHFGSYNKTWGTLSAVVVTLVWLWLTSLALLFGAEVNAAVRRGSSGRPR